MPQVNKIEKYELGPRVLELSVGRCTQEVADLITDELHAKGINDSLSQATISRFVRSIREARAEATRTKVQEHIQEHVPADLNAIEEIEGWLIERFRGRVDLSEDIDRISSIGDAGKEKIRELAQEMASIIEGDHKTRAEFGMKAARLIELKLKYAGILENPEQHAARTVDPPDLEEFRRDLEEERGKVCAH